MKPEEAEKRWKGMIENIVREQFRKLIKIDFTCPYCGKKYTIEELGKLEEGDEMELVVKFANEIKAYCKLRNNCYGCPFFDEEVAYEDGCRLNNKPMFWEEGEAE